MIPGANAMIPGATTLPTLATERLELRWLVPSDLIGFRGWEYEFFEFRIRQA
ncbi:MAG TPA: hypothetical protein VES88_09810 [Gemmatimonadaceae bacterium]|nr:hypothetical protein [Gemmatimonadaceae bacterium]